MSCKRLGTLPAVALLLLTTWGCASRKSDVRLEMQREVVQIEPGVSGIAIDPAGRLDTRDQGNEIKVTMTGDPDLVATFDVPGRFEGKAMTEVSPGVYQGVFPVQKGETGTVSVVGHLRHPPSGAHRAYDAGKLLTLSSPPPEPERSEKPKSAEADPCIALDSRLKDFALFFDFDDFRLNEDAQGRLDEAKAILAATPGCRIVVLGHTDTIGEEAYNDHLSEYRARSVVEYLTRAGVASERLSIEPYGETHPIVVGQGKTGQSRNRRVEIRATNPYGG